MTSAKSDKELAFLRELYVSTDWGLRFSQLIDEHLKLPKRGTLLYLGVGTGGHAIELKDRSGEDVQITGVDENVECLDLARAKAIATNSNIEFFTSQLDSLGFEDDLFDVVLAETSLTGPEKLPRIISEMIRVSAPGATLALSLASASSFAEFYSIYWEALQRLERDAESNIIETIITGRPTVADVERIAAFEGLDSIQSWVRKEEFSYGSAKEFLNSPLITDFLLPTWLEPLPTELQSSARGEIANLLDEERNDMDFILSVKATLVVGRKEE